MPVMVDLGTRPLPPPVRYFINAVGQITGRVGPVPLSVPLRVWVRTGTHPSVCAGRPVGIIQMGPQEKKAEISCFIRLFTLLLNVDLFDFETSELDTDTSVEYLFKS